MFRRVAWICLLLLLLSGCRENPFVLDRSSGSQGDSAAQSSEEEPPPPQAEPDETEEAQPWESRAVVTLAVPEGYTLARIAMTLEELGVCAVEEFIGASQTGDFSDFPLVAEQAEDSRRCFRLEGYLSPATYEIYADESPELIIRRMLTHMEQRIDPELRAAVERSRYTFDEILTMASIIEKEAFGKEHMPGISAVLHNRLDIAMPLQCDVTITYVEGAIKPFIEGDKDYYNGFYNTYKCEALPAGPICNPSTEAIRAALNPPVSEYLFFVTDEHKNYYYAETWEEHLENVEKAGL